MCLGGGEEVITLAQTVLSLFFWKELWDHRKNLLDERIIWLVLLPLSKPWEQTHQEKVEREAPEAPRREWG